MQPCGCLSSPPSEPFGRRGAGTSHAFAANAALRSIRPPRSPCRSHPAASSQDAPGRRDRKDRPRDPREERAARRPAPWHTRDFTRAGHSSLPVAAPRSRHTQGGRACFLWASDKRRDSRTRCWSGRGPGVSSLAPALPITHEEAKAGSGGASPAMRCRPEPGHRRAEGRGRPGPLGRWPNDECDRAYRRPAS